MRLWSQWAARRARVLRDSRGVEIRLTKQVRQRCAERMIPTSAVELCVRDPDRAVPIGMGRDHQVRYLREFTWGAIRTTVRHEGDVAVVITVSWETPAPPEPTTRRRRR